MDHLEHVRLELAEAILEQTCEKYFTFFRLLKKSSFYCKRGRENNEHSQNVAWKNFSKL